MNNALERHKWRCLEITTRPQNRNADVEPKELIRLEWPGIHILYTHNRHVISHVAPGVAADAILDALGVEAGSGYEIPDWERLEGASPNDLWRPTSPLLLLQPERADMPAALALYDCLRFFLNKGALPDSLYILTNSSVWDVLHDPEQHSQLIADPRVYEYLLWDDGGLSGSEGTLNDAQVWPGVGWIGPRCRDYGGEDPLRLPVLLAQDFWDALELLERLPGHRGSELDGAVRPERSSAYTYIDSLARFLPPFRGRKGDWLPAIPGSWGGVRKFRKIDDAQVDSLSRHLLLDGWLSLWKKGDERLLQPSSIVLMYWVAREQNKRHTETPEQFLAGYDWSGSPWFSRRWTRSKTTTD